MINIEKLQDFKDRKIKAKNIFSIKDISKNEAYNFIKEYHYLGDAKFFCKFAYGLFIDNILVGCSVYASPQGISSLKGWFNLDNTNQTVMELHRLCMLPSLNGSNATSFLLGGSIKQLKKEGIQAVITLADDSKHVGSIYQVCNFKYYGLTDRKTDFFSEDGRVNPRGVTRTVRGVWLPRTQKHRYCFILDKSLKCLLEEQERPTLDKVNEYSCCNGTNQVLDKRFNEWHECPKCK